MPSIYQYLDPVKFDSNRIKTIIFDLGGVVLNLDVNRTLQAFARLANVPVDKLIEHNTYDDIFHAYEMGRISTNSFLERMKQLFPGETTDEQVIDAWNAMLLDLPLDRLAHLERLRSNYKTIILSNTNELHLEAFNQIIAEATSGNKLSDYFDTVYYSHEMGMRKPNSDIFEFVLSEHGLRADETLFIDDMIQNIEGARSVGLETWHMTDQSKLITELTYG